MIGNLLDIPIYLRCLTNYIIWFYSCFFWHGTIRRGRAAGPRSVLCGSRLSKKYQSTQPSHLRPACPITGVSKSDQVSNQKAPACNKELCPWSNSSPQKTTVDPSAIRWARLQKKDGRCEFRGGVSTHIRQRLWFYSEKRIEHLRLPIKVATWASPPQQNKVLKMIKRGSWWTMPWTSRGALVTGETGVP